MELEKRTETTQPIASNELPKTTRNAETSKVEVALRVRPFISKEILDNETKCVTCFLETNQIIMGKDRQFVFDKVFDDNAKQVEIYEHCAKRLVIGCLNGYNATVLAYGQTGSGKTYTMGSTAACDNLDQNIGIIPRVIKDIFIEIDQRKVDTEFLVKVSFLEIYNEDIHDLLDPNLTNARLKINQNFVAKNQVSIREEKDGSISVYGITEEKVSSYEEIAACLERGSLHRSTASTLMNETSSRSHAIFTISIDQNQIGEQKGAVENSFMTAKFHFVDLAGSERAKKTGATGAILREGININRGLLALGNVISALTDDTSKIFHVPYRESKLTRILQDSLGGNSRTIMIACISPAESNFEESLNTLKYASRARNIKNKPIVNRDPQSALITQLKQQVFELQNEILGYRRILISQNNLTPGNLSASMNLNGVLNNLNATQNISLTKSLILPNINLKGYNNNTEETIEELKNCKIKLVQYEKQLNNVLAELQTTKKALNESEINLYSIQRERDLLKIINDKYKAYLQEHQIAIKIDESLSEVENKNIIEEYIQNIEKLKQELNDQNKLNKELQFEYESILKSSNQEHELLISKTRIIQDLQRKIRNLEKTNRQYQQNQKNMLSNSQAFNIQDQFEQQQQQELDKQQGTLGSNTKRNHNNTNKDQERKHNIQQIDTEIVEIGDSASAIGGIGGESALLTEINDMDSDIETEYDLKNEEDEVIEKEYESYTQLHKKEMLLVDGTLTEKEDLLKSITHNQMILEKNLMEEMKNQYHHKIHQLENELKVLEKQRDEAINKININSSMNLGQQQQHNNDRDKIIVNYKQKLMELETKMKEFKKKEKDQNNLMKLVQSQQNKIKELDEEIKKMKTQKLQLAKKMREESEKYEKWKMSRQREITQMKKKNMEKDAEIQKLKNENKRKDMMYKKKAEELLAKHISPDLMKQIQVTPSRINPNSSYSALGGIHSSGNKAGAGGNTREKGKNAKSVSEKLTNISTSSSTASLITEAPSMTEENIREIVDLCTQKLIENLEINYAIQKEDELLKKSEMELDIEQKRYAEILLRKDKLELEKENIISNNGGIPLDLASEEDYLHQLQEYILNLNEIYGRIETLEENIKYKQGKINELTHKLSTVVFEMKPEDILINLNNNQQNNILIIRVLLAKYIASNFDLYKLQERIKQYIVDLQEYKKKLDESEQKYQLAELQFEINLTKLKKEYEHTQMLWFKNDEDDNMEQTSSASTANKENNSTMISENNSDEKSNSSEFSSANNTQQQQYLSLAQARQKKHNQMNPGMNKLKSNNSQMNRNGNNNNSNVNDQISPMKKNDSLWSTTTSVSNTNINTNNASTSTTGTNNMKLKANNDSTMESNKKLEKIIADLRMKNKEYEKEIESLKRKYETVQSKKQSGKEKNTNSQKYQDDQSMPSPISITPAPNFNNMTISTPNIMQNLTLDMVTTPSQASHHHNLSSQPGSSTQTNSATQFKQIGWQKSTASSAFNPSSTTNASAINNNAQNIATTLNNSAIANQNKLQFASFKDRRKEEKEIKTGITNLKPISVNDSAQFTEESKIKKRSANIVTTKSSVVTAPQGSHINMGLIQQTKQNKPNTMIRNPSKLDPSPPPVTEPNNNNKESMLKLSFNAGNRRYANENELDTRNNAMMDYESSDSYDKVQFFEDLGLADESGFIYKNKWKCIESWEAHSNQIYSVVSFGNMLYSSTNKAFKVWSLDNLSMISKINAHSGNIKSMVIWPEKRMLVTACDKTINFWDLISLHNEYTLKAKDEIFTLHISNNILFSAGKGSPTNGAILAWDLRNLNVIEEKEKNQEIYSLASHQNTLYYGCKNHQVRRMNLLNMECLAPFEPSHDDVVSSLAIVKDNLVSGSKDKSLRLWNIDTCIQNLKDSSNAHQDQINTIETNISKSMFYTGSRNGVVKIWNIRDSKLNCLSSINAHTQPISSICKLYDDHANMFATASNEKLIKLWKPNDDEFINLLSDEDGIEDTGILNIHSGRSYSNRPY